MDNEIFTKQSPPPPNDNDTHIFILFPSRVKHLNCKYSSSPKMALLRDLNSLISFKERKKESHVKAFSFAI